MKNQLIFSIIWFVFSCAPKPVEVPSDMVLIEGNEVIGSFLIEKNVVTVAQFREFVKATGYRTQAELFGNAGVFNQDSGVWEMRDSAFWEFPYGKNEPPAPNNHPVTQVSWYDAQAYCKWKNRRLPTVAEWELAASAGNTDQLYAWGNEVTSHNKYLTNVWQGEFPYTNTGEDGWLTTAPVGIFGLTPSGLSDMGGNVWQWCADEVSVQHDTTIYRALKSGSFLCDADICHGFRIKGGSSSSPETGLCHIGFRCVASVK